MVNHRRFGCVLGLLSWLALAPATAIAQAPGRPSQAIASRTATVDGLTLHYLTAGRGPGSRAPKSWAITPGRTSRPRSGLRFVRGRGLLGFRYPRFQ